tara:strand:+ start:497 stop:640 length:144 start_codon:yes stop_codon:yes gene_type:complete
MPDMPAPEMRTDSVTGTPVARGFDVRLVPRFAADFQYMIVRERRLGS